MTRPRSIEWYQDRIYVFEVKHTPMTLKTQKKAVVTAAQSMILSACPNDNDARKEKMSFSFAKVTGMRLGEFRVRRLIALTSM